MRRKVNPFADTAEFQSGLLGPELWRIETQKYTAAVRRHKNKGRFILVASTMVNGEAYLAAMDFETCPPMNEATVKILDKAFIKALAINIAGGSNLVH